MANELRHSDVGTALSKSEWEAVGSHILNSQAAGDLIYASSTSQLSRLAIGTANQFLVSTGSAPSWTSSPAVNTAITPDASDGATLGTAALEWSDLYLADAAVIYFGDDDDVTLTHVHNDGLLLSSTDQLQFGDSGTFIHQSSDGVLTIQSDTTVDINGAVALNGAITGATNITLSGELDAATLDISGNADIDGTTNLDAVDIDGAVQIDAAFTSGVDGQGYDTKFFGDTSGAYMLWDTSADDLVFAGAAGIDLAGDIDVDGTANLDAVDIDGAVQLDNTFTIGANDQGYDVIFYGDTASANMTWDTSVDDLILNGAARMVIPDGQLVLASTAVGSTAAELNMLDGSAKSTSSITIADADAFIVIDGTTTKQIPASDIVTYIGAGSMSNFILEDDDGTEVTISNAKEVKFIGSGLTTNWTDTDNGTDADPYDLTFTVDAAQTGITSIYATDLIIGEDSQTAIDFGTVNEIDFKADNAARLTLTASALYPVTDNEIDLGTASLEFKDAFFDGTVTADAFAGPLTGTASTATVATTVTITDNESTDENNAIIFTAGGDVDGGNLGLESDGHLTYNPSTGHITATGLTTTGGIELGHASDTTLARSASGTVTIEGDVITTAGVMDMWIPAGAMRAASTNGCADITDVETTATRPDMQVLDFDSSTQEYAQFSIAMPKSWNEGTVTAQFYWTHATAVSTDVIWGIQGVCVSDNDTIDVAYGTAQTVTDTFHNTAEDLAISAATSAITLAGSPAEGDLAFFQVYRDADAAGDTTNSTDARLVGVKLMFTTNAANDA